MKTVKRSGGYDGAHRGVSDFYSDYAEQIQEALDDGEDFTTGWYSSKHAIASGRVTRKDGMIVCQVSVSNDFDEMGSEGIVIENTTELKRVQEALEKALDGAYEDQKDNATVTMYSIHDDRGRWIETYLIDANPYATGREYPPGDYYHQWGWQYEKDIPEDIKRELKDGMHRLEETVNAGGYEAQLAYP